jgi:GNAT superfamily N-acetyltransferase
MTGDSSSVTGDPGTVAMPDISIRPATRGDEDTFLALVDALADYERLARPTPEARERLRRDGFGENPLFRAYLAELDGRAAAYAITFFTYSSFLAKPTLYLEDLFVLPEARRHGVGKALFAFLAREAVERGCGRMEWVVLDWNQLAIDFYEKLGARRLEEWYTYRLTAEELEAMAASGGEGA